MNSSFSTQQHLLQTAWDATSLELLKTCPRKYYLSIISGYTTSEENVHLTFGILYHQAQDLFERLLAEGNSRESATIKCTRYLLESTWNEKLSRPWDSGNPNKNRFTLVRSFVWYLDHYKDDAAKTLIFDGRPAVELSFQYQTSKTSLDGEPFLICGHMDKLAEIGSQTFVFDHKTTKYNVLAQEFFEFYSPDNQMSLYSFAGKIIYNTETRGCVIDAAQVMVGFTRFRRGFAQRTLNQINEWYLELTEFWLPLAETYARKQYWPMNDTACGRYGGCQFRSICGKDPKARPEWLAAGFKTRAWDPLKVRGDV